MKTQLALALAAGWLSLSALGGTLPPDLKWETEGDVPLIGDPNAEKGGTLKVPLETYPLTFRKVGPDSNTVLYLAIVYNNLSLIDFHPNTKQPIALLAEAWAMGPDGRSVYYRLDPKAKWSDGKPVVAEDFTFALEFYRSKHINAPWYNTYYTEEVETVEIIEPNIIRVVIPKKKPDMLYDTALAPLPKHFYKGTVSANFVSEYNWKVEPNTGPYQIDEDKVKKGRSVTWTRKKDWWAKDKPFFKGRFNVDTVLYKVVREQTVQWEHFKNGELDYFVMQDPSYWHEKSKTEVFDKGYAEKLWLYTDRPQMCFGIWMNTSFPLFKDVRVREGIAYATNFDKVIDTILRGEAERKNGCDDGYGEYTNPAVKARPFDLAKANKFFDDAGYNQRNAEGIRVNAQGQKLEFRLAFAYDGHKEKLVPIVEDMRKAGIHMILDLKDWSAQIKESRSNKHEAVYSGLGAREFGVPEFWGTFHRDNANKPDSNNKSNLDDKELSDDIIRYRDSSDKAERVQLAHKIQQRIHDSSVLIPSYQFPWVRIGHWRYWRFPQGSPGTKLTENPFEVYEPARGGLFWFDKKRHEETMAAKKDGKAFPPVVRVDETFRNPESKKKAEAKKAPQKG